MKKYIAILRYLLSIHVFALIIMSLFRGALYWANMHQVKGLEDGHSLLSRAMFKGILFDNVIACYVVALPLLILTILALANKLPKIAIKISNVYFIVLYTLVFALSAANIPYFQYFSSHMGVAALVWLKFGGETAGMMLQESAYYVYFALFFAVVILFVFVTIYFGRQVFRAERANLQKRDYRLYIPLTIILWGVCFVGIRGGLERYPLRIGGAYFCNNSFINQLGINPVFFMIKSGSSYMNTTNYLDGLMDESDALSSVQKELCVVDSIKDFCPISRTVHVDGFPKNANVVVVLMESLSTGFLEYEYKGNNLMPYLNSLINKSYYFENFYSAGTHTNNGIASTLYGYPPHFDKTMMGSEVTHYVGLPYTLKSLGYQTLFFLTSNPQYDNMNSFLYENGFDRIYSQYDYPEDKVVNNFGVQDDYLFEYGVDRLNEAAKKDKPFFATFMTVSNHPPLIIPDRFKDSADTDEKRIIAFADYSLQSFMQAAEKQDWYRNTIFVFLGDHGKNIEKHTYDMILSLNHIPLVIYSPMFDDMPKRFTQFGNQMDVFPTVMGLLNHTYQNNSLGDDLLKTNRPFTYFVSDHHLGCIGDEFFYIYTLGNKNEGLYRYRERETDNLNAMYPVVVDSMRSYSVSMMMAANYLVKNKLTGLAADKK